MDINSKKSNINKGAIFKILIISIIIGLSILFNYIFLSGYLNSRVVIILFATIVILLIFNGINKFRVAMIFFSLSESLRRLEDDMSINYSMVSIMIKDSSTLNLLGKNVSKLYISINKLLDLSTESGKKASENREEENLINKLILSLEVPSNNIIKNIELLRTDNESNVDVLNDLYKEEKILKEDIERLFECSKILSRDIEVNRMPLDIVSIIKNTFEEFEEDLLSREVIYEFDIKSINVYGDGEKLWTSIRYLIKNAIKHSKEDSRIFINVIPIENDKYSYCSKVKIEIKNTSKDFIKDFNEGIELKVVRKIVDLQGGTLAIERDGDLFKAVITLEYGGDNKC
ncbi:MAG: hypothetical protein RSD13_00280 [Clostridium sp.]